MTNEHTVDTTKQKKSGLNPAQKLRIYDTIILTVASILNLFQGVGGFNWSTVFENFIAAYKAIVHLPVDWLFRWISITIPWWIKDVIVIYGSWFLAFNIYTRSDNGDTLWGRTGYEFKKSTMKGLIAIYEVLFPFISLPWAYFFSRVPGKKPAVKPL